MPTFFFLEITLLIFSSVLNMFTYCYQSFSCLFSFPFDCSEILLGYIDFYSWMLFFKYQMDHQSCFQWLFLLLSSTPRKSSHHSKSKTNLDFWSITRKIVQVSYIELLWKMRGDNKTNMFKVQRREFSVKEQWVYIGCAEAGRGRSILSLSQAWLYNFIHIIYFTMF